MQQRGHRRQHGGEAAQREHVRAAGGARVAVQQREPVALAVGVEDAVGQAAHQRALLLAPPARADRLHERAHLGRDARRARAAPLHQLAHARLADAHPRGGLGAREPLQVAERRGLLLARAQARAQRLEQLAQPRTVVELRGDVALARPARCSPRAAPARRAAEPAPSRRAQASRSRGASDARRSRGGR